MSYFNDADNDEFYSSVSRGFYSYPPPSRMFVVDNGGATGQMNNDPTDQWRMVRRSGPMVGSPTSLRANTSLGERHLDLSFHRFVSDMCDSRISGPDHLVYEWDRWPQLAVLRLVSGLPILTISLLRLLEPE